MSKKSRRRNKKILATIAALGGAAMLANRRRDNSIAANEAKEAGYGTEKDFKETIVPSSVVSTPVTTKTTIMDSMPARPKKNVLSNRVTDKGEVYTIKGASEGVPKKIGNRKSAFVGDNYIYRDGKPYTKGRFGTFAARNKKPAMLGLKSYTAPIPNILEGVPESALMAKKGGRIVKGKKTAVRTGAAKRGFGRAFKGGRK